MHCRRLHAIDALDVLDTACSLLLATARYCSIARSPPVLYSFSSLAHYVGLVLAYWLLSILRRHIAKEEEKA